MATKKPKKPDKKQVDTSDDESGSGSQSSSIEFADFLSSGVEKRDDMLSREELKRLLGTHEGAHEDRVKKQKELREERKNLKEGKISKSDYRSGMAKSHSQYPAHPVLSNKAQFSGIDKQNSALPTENVANTNDENRNELENQYRLRHAPQNAPRFNPKPTPR